MRLKPARPGSAIPDPAEGDMLPAGGRDVSPTAYWRRRLRDGDVVAAVDAPRAEQADAGERPAEEVTVIVPGDIVIPQSWRDLPWTQPKGDGVSLRTLAASLSPTPIITRDQAVEAIEAELDRRRANEET